MTNSAIFDLAISTVSRPEDYIHKLIASLRKDIPICLVVGSPSYSYLELYSRNSRIKIVKVDPAEWEFYKEFPVQYRASWNYWRCFEYGVRAAGERKNGLLILEDDVIPDKGWEERLAATIEQIEAEFGEEFVLSLYTYHTKLAKPVANKYYARYPVYTFGGTQAVYYPESVRMAFSDYIKSEGVEIYRMPYDWLLSEYLRLTGIPLFVTTPCLFQHIGEITTGLSWGFHQAKHFVSKSPRKRGIDK